MMGDHGILVVSEVNRFYWPGVDLRAVPGKSCYEYGVLPPGLFPPDQGRDCRLGAVARACGRRQGDSLAGRTKRRGMSWRGFSLTVSDRESVVFVAHNLNHERIKCHQLTVTRLPQAGAGSILHKWKRHAKSPPALRVMGRETRKDSPYVCVKSALWNNSEPLSDVVDAARRALLRVFSISWPLKSGHPCWWSSLITTLFGVPARTA